MPVKPIVKAIVTDIEGTTTALDFVHKVLFPYARQVLPSFVFEHHHEPTIVAILDQIPGVTLEAKVEQLLVWMDEDCKITPLKALQGLVWRQGYKRADFSGHVYSDAFSQLQNWHQQGITLYVFSSGSIQAQQLLFRYSDYGDMTLLFSGYFDTTLGPKRECSSYQKMAQRFLLQPEQILFLSDTAEELDAAQQADWQVIGLARNGISAVNRFTWVSDFYGIASLRSNT